MSSAITAVRVSLFMAAMAFEGSAPGPKPILDPSQADGVLTDCTSGCSESSAK
jgi:hypothetical protein